MIKHHGETNNSLNPKNTNVELCLTRDKIYLVDDGWEMRNNNYFKKYNKINYSNKYAQSYNEDKNNNNFTITINKILNSLLNTIIRIFKKIKRKLWEWKIK